MDSLLFAFLAGIIGGELATSLAKNNTKRLCCINM